MDTSGILTKIRSFKGAFEPEVKRLNRLKSAARSQAVERVVRTCTDLFNRTSVNISMARVAFDGRLPPVPGWPRHRLAPGAKEVAEAEEEAEIEEAELRAQRAQRAQREEANRKRLLPRQYAEAIARWSRQQGVGHR